MGPRARSGGKVPPEKGGKKRKGVPTKAPPMPNVEDFSDDELEVGDDDLEFVAQHRAYMGGFTTSDVPRDSRKEKKQKRAAAAAAADMEAAYERVPRGQQDSDEEGMDGQPGVPLEALPVKAADGTLHYIKSTKKERREADVAKAAREQADARSAKAKADKKGSKGGNTRADVSASTSDGAARDKQKDGGSSAEKEKAAEGGDGGVGKGAGTAKHDFQSQMSTERAQATSALQSMADKEERRTQLKLSIANAATKLLEAPEEHVPKLKELLPLCADKDEVVAQLAMLSLLAVFKDICPGYRVRLPTEKELEVKVSREVQRVRDFERLLLRGYQSFLRNLLNASNTRNAANALTPRARTAVRCMCGLLTALPHFNYRTDLLSALVPKASDLEPSVHGAACEALASLFTDDRRGEATLEAAQMVAQAVKDAECQVPVPLVDAFMKLRFDADLRRRLDLDGETVDPRKQRGKFKFNKNKGKSKTEPDEEAEAALSADMRESEAVMDPRERRKLQTQILEAMFEVYFRILKMGKGMAVALLPSTFAGLAKFSHLISIDFLGDLLVALQARLLAGDLPVALQLHGLLAACDVLSGQGSALNVDPSGMLQLLYGILGRPLPHGEGVEGEPAGQLVVTACKRMLCDARSIDMSRLAAFVKRLANAALHAGAGEATGLVAAARFLMARHVTLRAALDNDGAIPGVYKPDALDPAESGAQSTMLWEIALLPHHWHPAVRAAGTAVAGMPLDGPAPTVGASRPDELFMAHDTTRGAFAPPVQAPSKQRSTHGSAWRLERIKGPRSEAFGGHVGAQHQWERHAWGEGEAAGAGEDDTALEAALRNMYRQNRDFAENTALHGELRMLDWKLRKFREHLAAKKDKGAQANGKTEKEAANAAKPAKKTKHSRK